MRMRIKTLDWAKIRRLLDRSFNDSKSLEWGVICSVKIINVDVCRIEEVMLPEKEHDLDQKNAGLRFSANYIRRSQLKAKKQGCDGLAFFHTHPSATNRVKFSDYDDVEEPKLVKNLQDVWEGCVIFGFVVGKNSIQGRAYHENAVIPVSRIIVPGETILVLSGDGMSYSKPKTSGIFDRGVALTGTGALNILENLHVCVIGAGGTGSLMIELLRRAGCKRITVIDHDCVEETNLNRVLFSSCLDVQEQRKKVFVAATANEQSGLKGQLIPVIGDITDPLIQRHAQNADLLVGCVDNETARFILNEIVVKDYIPLVDLGSEIGASADEVQSLDARVTYVYPGGPCLLCRNLIDFERMRLEGLQPEERRRHIGMGYCKDIDLKQPAVMELNMRAASLASLLIRHLLQPFLDPKAVGDCREAVLTLAHRAIPRPEEGCGKCGYKKEGHADKFRAK